jgi:hypothetical protein
MTVEDVMREARISLRMEEIKKALNEALEEVKHRIDEVRQLPTKEAKEAFAVRLVKEKLKAIPPVPALKGKSRSEDRLILRKKKAWNRTKAQKTAKMRYSPNRTTGKLIYRISHHKHFSWRLLAGGVYSVFRTHNSFSRTASRSHRSLVRSAAKSGGDDGGDSESDPGEPPGPKLVLPSHNSHSIPQLNNSILSRTPHPCHWCMDWRWAA